MSNPNSPIGSVTSALAGVSPQETKGSGATASTPAPAASGTSGAHATSGTSGTARAPAGKASDAKLHHAAQQFEEVLIRQLLAAAKIGGKGGSSGYADMAVDSLATGIEKGGGLGLAKAIEESLRGRR